jgi:hypothetical protein
MCAVTILALYLDFNTRSPFNTKYFLARNSRSTEQNQDAITVSPCTHVNTCSRKSAVLRTSAHKHESHYATFGAEVRMEGYNHRGERNVYTLRKYIPNTTRSVEWPTLKTLLMKTPKGRKGIICQVFANTVLCKYNIQFLHLA